MHTYKPMPVVTPAIAASFNARVARAGPDECWPWLGGKTTGRMNYGRFTFRGTRYIASRFAFHLNVGPFERHEIVCHTYDNPLCCNPGHLFIGTHFDNLMDCTAKGRASKVVGERHYAARLSDAAVMQIRASADTTAALSRRFGVSPIAIRRVRNGTGWRHVA